MRHPYFLILVLSILGGLASAAYAFFRFDNAPSLSAPLFIEAFQKTHPSRFTIDLSALYGGAGQFRVLNPLLDLRQLKVPLPSSTCSPVQTDFLTPIEDPSNACSAALATAADMSSLGKKDKFVLLLKREISAPEDFILNPPFIYETGDSYASILTRKDIEPFNNPRWVANHLSFYKTSELREVLDRFKIDDQTFEALSRLTEAELKSLVEGLPIVLTTDYFMIRDQSNLGFSPLKYFVFEARDLRLVLKDQRFDLVADTPNGFCFEHIGNACWTYSSQTAMSYLHRYSVVLVSVGVFMSLLISVTFAKAAFERRRSERRHRTSLQVLSHEFRTPVSVLLLLIEQLTKNSSRLAPDDEDLVAKMSTETFRLQRIIEMSRTYLQPGTDDTSRFKWTHISSVNTWLYELASELDPRVQCALLKIDRSIEADIFWLRFVIANLVQNAFAHGKEPILIRLSEVSGHIRLSVEDHGICEFESLREMSKAFVKSSTSQGMGLGLNMASAVIREWGGRLEFSKQPTSFALNLKAKAEGAKSCRKF